MKSLIALIVMLAATAAAIADTTVIYPAWDGSVWRHTQQPYDTFTSFDCCLDIRQDQEAGDEARIVLKYDMSVIPTGAIIAGVTISPTIFAGGCNYDVAVYIYGNPIGDPDELWYAGNTGDIVSGSLPTSPGLQEFPLFSQIVQWYFDNIERDILIFVVRFDSEFKIAYQTWDDTCPPPLTITWSLD